MNQPFRLKQSFASNVGVDLQDTRTVKRILNRLGYYIPPHDVLGMTRFPDRQVFEAVKAFQKDKGLFVNGEMNPGDKTEVAMNAALESQSPFDQYIWHTQQDDKVRGAHAAREGEVFSWGNPPDGGHPGEDYNCRCWAKPVPVQVAPADKNFVSASAKPRKCFVGGDWEEQLKTMLGGGEGNITWPYLDSEGKVTVGIGTNVDNKAVFLVLPFYLAVPNTDISIKDATRDDKEAGYTKIKASMTGMDAIKYLPLTDLRLTREVILQKRDERLRDAVISLKKYLKGFDCFPPPARIALGDMMYNMGQTNFNPTKWDDLFKAANERDWETAAKECHRLKIPESRNTETGRLFREAAQMERDAR